LRIAQVSPLIESVPPSTYGGTERVVSYLTEALMAAGHDVTLYATGDSITSARLRVCAKQALRFDSACRVPLAYDLMTAQRVLAEADEFDVIHFHSDLVQFPLFRGHPVPRLTTLHGRLDMPELGLFLREFPDMPLISISDSQRTPVSHASWFRTIHHGLPETLLPMGSGKGGYLAFLGRLSPEKGPERAIEIARRVGMPLKIAAKVDRVDEAYFETAVEPLLHEPGIEFIGEINDIEKAAFLGAAAALLFPINWPEPFGLVMIEAMACGTPVIAFNCGSVPEIIDHGTTGFIVDSIPAAVAAVERIGAFDRRKIRQSFETRFSSRRMAQDYLDAYAALIEGVPAVGRTFPGADRSGTLQHA